VGVITTVSTTTVVLGEVEVKDGDRDEDGEDEDEDELVLEEVDPWEEVEVWEVEVLRVEELVLLVSSLHKADSSFTTCRYCGGLHTGSAQLRTIAEKPGLEHKHDVSEVRHPTTKAAALTQESAHPGKLACAHTVVTQTRNRIS